jgi:hypothetical protein
MGVWASFQKIHDGEALFDLLKEHSNPMPAQLSKINKQSGLRIVQIAALSRVLNRSRCPLLLLLGLTSKMFRATGNKL